MCVGGVGGDRQRGPFCETNGTINVASCRRAVK